METTWYLGNLGRRNRYTTRFTTDLGYIWYMWRFPNMGVTPKSSIFLNMIFHEINHPFWVPRGTPISGNPNILAQLPPDCYPQSWLRPRFPIHGSINLTVLFFFLLLILGINIIRNMQGFWIAKLDFPDVFCMERSSHPLSNPWHHTPKWSKMNNLIQPLKQGVWRGVRYWRHGVQTECLRIWWGIITLW